MLKGHGDDIHNYPHILANFSANTWHGADLQPLQQHLAEQLGTLLPHYPEPQPYMLEAELAARLHVQPEEVCVTNGATEAIYLVAQAFRGAQSAVWQPTFSEYADACTLHGHRVRSLYQLPDARSRYRLDPETELLWLCDPNNPTGSVLPIENLHRLIEANPHTCFIIDRSYAPFTRKPLLTPTEAVALPHVLLLHSMTKRYAIPGLRLGYVTGPAPLLQELRTRRMPWSVNAVAIEAGRYLCRHEPLALPALDELLQETDRLATLLQTTGGVEVWPTDTHLLLCRLRMGTAAALKEYLALRHGLLIRDASNFEGLDNRFFRLATQAPAYNDLLASAISTFFQETG